MDGQGSPRLHLVFQSQQPTAPVVTLTCRTYSRINISSTRWRLLQAQVSAKLSHSSKFCPNLGALIKFARSRSIIFEGHLNLVPADKLRLWHHYMDVLALAQQRASQGCTIHQFPVADTQKYAVLSSKTPIRALIRNSEYMPYTITFVTGSNKRKRLLGQSACNR